MGTDMSDVRVAIDVVENVEKESGGEDPRRFGPGEDGVFGEPWERLRIGDTFTTRARTITEADVVQFAALTGDWHPAHSDAEWARQSIFGQRVAHGMLVITYAFGLVPNGAILALRRIKSVNFKKPVFFGDTIHVYGKVADKWPMSPEAGMVLGRWRIRNQDEEVICTIELEALWRRDGSLA